MAWAALILAIAAVAVMARGLALIVEGRRRGRRRAEDAEERMVAGLRVAAGVRMVNRGALVLVLALLIAVAL